MEKDDIMKKEPKTTGNRFVSTANEIGVAKLGKKGQAAMDRLNGMIKNSKSGKASEDKSKKVKY